MAKGCPFQLGNSLSRMGKGSLLMCMYPPQEIKYLSTKYNVVFISFSPGHKLLTRISNWKPCKNQVSGMSRFSASIRKAWKSFRNTIFTGGFPKGNPLIFRKFAPWLIICYGIKKDTIPDRFRSPLIPDLHHFSTRRKCVLLPMVVNSLEYCLQPITLNGTVL